MLQRIAFISIEYYINSRNKSLEKEGHIEYWNILKAFHAYNSLVVHSVGDVFKEFETKMLKAGLPLNKIKLFRDMLKEHGFALTSSTHLRRINYLIKKKKK